MIESFVDVALPEEAAGEAYQIVKRELITPFEKWIGAGRVREHDWSLKGRIQTNGEVVRETVEMAGGDKKAVLVKGPGVTPTKAQVAEMLALLGDDRKPEELSKLATGTPNGYMRGHWLVKGNLERYQNPGLNGLIKTVLPTYENAGRVEVLYPDGGRYKDAECVVLDTDAEVFVEFNRKIVREPEKLSAGSAVYFKLTRRDEIEKLCAKAIAKKNEIVFMSKYTVRPELDGEKKRIYNDMREKAGLERREGNQRDIVDAAFAHLLAHPVSQDTTVLVPDASYGPKIAAVAQAVYANGLKKPADEFSVCRFSAGKCEYGGLNKTVTEDGFFRIVVGRKEFRIPVSAGDMFEEMHYDYADAKRYAEQVFRQARNKDYKRVIFAFDETDAFDAPVAKAVRDTAYGLKQVEGADFMLMRPDAAAVMMFTAPAVGKTCYAYDNLWGDIVSDAMDLGTSIASINSVVLLADGRIWAEMGGAGTAPDLVERFKKEGFWRYDPIPIIEGMAIGFAQSAAQEPANFELSRYAAALHQAYVDVLKKGVATPDLAGKLTTKTQTGVDTESFVKAVRVRLHALLGENDEAAVLAEKLKQETREIR